MIQVDLNSLKEKWYQLGLAGTEIKGDNAVLFKSLDAWQKKELINSYESGKKHSNHQIA